MRVNLFAFAILAVAGLQVSAKAQTTQWQPSSSIQKVGYFQDDKTDVAELQETIKKLELRLREVEDDVEERLESAVDPSEAAEQADTFEKRMAELEKSFEENDMQFFGRIHLDYWAFPNFSEGLEDLGDDGNPQDRYNFRRLRIGIKGDLNDNMFYKYEGEFAGGNNPSYRDAFIGFKNVPYLNTVIIGNHKRPYGLDHLNSSRHNVTIERPFVVEAFNQDSRRLGVSSNGVAKDQSANWRFGVWSEVLTQTRDGYVGDDYQLELAGRYAKTYWYDESSGGRGWGHFAISGSVGLESSAMPKRTTCWDLNRLGISVH